MQNKMRIAIVHDSLLHLGGAEKVLQSFIKTYPNSDIFVALLSIKYVPILNTNGKVHRSFLSKLPFIEKYSSILKPLVLLYWEFLDLKKYDLIISSSHSFSSKSVNKSKTAKHVSYIHTPPKYLYCEFNEMNWIKKFPFNILLFPLFYILRKHDYYSAQKPDLLIANSKNVQKRIKKYYNRNSVIIYPPHNTAPNKFVKEKGKYFLFFSRLEKQKGVKLVVKTCTKYNLPLVVVGTGSQEQYLKSIAGDTIDFRGYVSEKEKLKIFSNTKALLYASIDEDYGMIIPEIISYNIPIIAYDSGAINEMSLNTKTLITFKKHTIPSLNNAIQQLPL